MKVRVISGVAAGVLMIAVLVVCRFFPEMLYIMAAVIGMLASYEIAGATGTRKSKSITAVSVATAVALPFTGLSADPALAAEVLICLYGVAAFGLQLRKHKDIPMPSLMVTMLITLLVPFSLMHMYTVRTMNGGTHGVVLVILMLLSAWSSDTGAYFAGVNFGKHKLCPLISPKKTVEGFIGGILSCVLILEIVALVYGFVICPGTDISYLSVGITAAVCSVISVLGDLTFSLLKRHYGIKDYGNIMPGHGGALDRFDSVTFVAPIFTMLITFFPLIHV